MARTLRLQHAERLIDQTRLPMSNIAARAASPACAGNAVFAEVYQRTPSELPRLRFKPV